MRVVLSLVILLWAASASAQQVEFECDFTSNPGDNENFCFDGKGFPVVEAGRTIEWLPTGGATGNGAARITINACTPMVDCGGGDAMQCGYEGEGCFQGATGWTENAIGGTYSEGDSRFFRIIMRITSAFSGGSKWVVIDGPNASGDRPMIQMNPPYNNNDGCQPSGEGNDFYNNIVGDTDPTNAFLTAEDFGLAMGWTEIGPSSVASHYAILTPRLSVGWNCAPFVVMPNTNAVADIKPQQRGTATTDGWLFYQLEWIMDSDCGEAGFKVWANNDDYANPSGQNLNMDIETDYMIDMGGASCAIIPSEFGGAFHLGSFWQVDEGDAETVIEIDYVALSENFDPNFFGGGGGPEPDPSGEKRLPGRILRVVEHLIPAFGVVGLLLFTRSIT